VSLLNFSGESNYRQGEKKTLRLLFGIGALVGTIALGSTLAASINLNGGGPVEFGQGVTQTTSCDSEILVTPYSSFVNGDPGEFMFTSLRLEGVDTTSGSGSNEGCAGKTFTIKLYDEEGDLIGTSITILVLENGDFSSLDGEVLQSGAEATNRTASFGFLSPTLSASDVYRITIESSASNSIVDATTMSISTGRDFTCESLDTGNVQCWGSNTDGQLGNGTTTNQSTPVAVNGLSEVAEISGGGYHACARLTSGTVKCWGRNADGQLGNGTENQSSTPVSVSDLSDVSAITAGRNHTCAVLNTDGTVKCWGSNGDGQLGNGTNALSSTPVTVSNLSGVAAISAGDRHTCALRGNGQVLCWGGNGNGQLGISPADFDEATVPELIPDLSDVIAIDAGNNHTCALLLSGVSPEVKCWGANSFGQLGDGTTDDSATPLSISGLSDARAISAGGNHTCALLITDNVKCWGKNDEGQLGDGTTSDRLTPGGTISGLAAVLMISAGNNHTCALLESRVVKCWGGNGDGRLGDGTEVDRLTPVAVSREF
jgi:alpha-tubulin suppressor-like RCC1 family protein